MMLSHHMDIFLKMAMECRTPYVISTVVASGPSEQEKSQWNSSLMAQSFQSSFRTEPKNLWKNETMESATRIFRHKMNTGIKSYGKWKAFCVVPVPEERHISTECRPIA